MAKEEQHSNKTPKILRPKAGGSIAVRASGSTGAQFRVRLIPDIEELKKSISVGALREQGFTTNLPRTIEIVPSTDNSGADSLDVTVVFPKSMREEEVASAQTSRMLSWIQDTILSRSDESGGRWPYVFVKVEGKDVCPA
jgi:hypothetical protein